MNRVPCVALEYGQDDGWLGLEGPPEVAPRLLAIASLLATYSCSHQGDGIERIEFKPAEKSLLGGQRAAPDLLGELAPLSGDRVGDE